YTNTPWSTIRGLQNTFNTFDRVNEINKVYGLSDSMRAATTIAGINSSLFSPKIPDYSNLASMHGTDDIYNPFKNSLGNFDLQNRIISVGEKSSNNLIDIKFDNASKINELEKKLKQTTSKLKELENKNESLESQTLEYETLMRDKKSEEDELLLYKQRGHIISRINGIELANILQSEEFFKEFEHLKDIDAVVISIDIRKSTELMLKAISPQDFAIFITKLRELLSTIVTLNFGVFDKFTGDGILAFFPKFLTGENALLYALKTATECHELFEVHYKNHEFSFQVFNKSIGLGIGIECGKVTLVNNGVELTVVGTPVVYACRLGGAPSYTTLIGQKAMQTIIEKYDSYVEVENDEL